jgi:hypothetical protein
MPIMTAAELEEDVLDVLLTRLPRYYYPGYCSPPTPPLFDTEVWMIYGSCTGC